MLYLHNLKSREQLDLEHQVSKKYRQEDIKVAGAIFKVANTRYTIVVRDYRKSKGNSRPCL
jgi:hypothetical protein